MPRYCPRLRPNQTAELRSFIQDKETDKAEARRGQTILLLDRRIDLETITETTGYRERQVFELRREYLKRGLTALRSKRKGKPKELLTRNQIKEILAILKSQSPKDSGYNTPFWTTGALADLVERKYQVRYKSKTSYYLIFKRVKFTYHKPGRVFVKRDGEEVRKWQRRTRPLLAKAWADPQTVILCGDEMILSTQTTLQKVWLPQGETPQVEVANTRRNLSIYGFLNLKTGQEHSFLKERQTMFMTRRVLQGLRRIYPSQDNRGNRLKGRKLLILWDNPGWHRGSAVIDYIRKDSKIEVIYFPKYAPEENPQEHVWKEGRAKVTHNTFIGNLEETAKDFVSYLNQTKFPYSLLDFGAKS